MNEMTDIENVLHIHPNFPYDRCGEISDFSAFVVYRNLKISPHGSFVTNMRYDYIQHFKVCKILNVYNIF